jgi:glycosyltransferase involved in cell wall biosynthesis
VILGVDARELQGRPTGTGRYLRTLLSHWSRSGRDRIVAYFKGPDGADSLVESPAVTPRVVGRGDERALVWLERLLPPAVHADGVEVLFCPAYVCPLSLDRPRVTAIHDLSFFSVPEDFAFVDGLRRRLTVGASARASAGVLTISDFTRREIAHWLPEVAERVTVTPLGTDDDLRAPPPRGEARARLGVSGPLVLTVGSIFNRRRLPELLRAFARLRRLWPDALLDVVGDNRTEPRQDFPAAARALGLEAAIRLSGYVDEAGLADRYAAADVAVFLSEYEGFGLPVLEAMSRGVPAVVSRAPALGELFGEAAAVVDPRDVPGIERALSDVLGDAAVRAGLVERGRVLAARFSWTETARRTREVLERAARR